MFNDGSNDRTDSTGNLAADRFVERANDLTSRANNPELSADERATAVSNLAKLATEMSKAALTDHLTGLPNARALEYDLNWWGIHGSIGAQNGVDSGSVLVEDERRQPGQGLAVGVVDFDGFKFGNDTLGHDAMNLVLTEAARLLAGLCREGDYLYRTGGDELSYLFIGGMSTPEDVAAFRNRLDEVVATIVGRYPILGELHFGISFGLVQFDPRVHSDFNALHRAADLAMYDEKRAKARSWSLFLFRIMRLIRGS